MVHAPLFCRSLQIDNNSPLAYNLQHKLSRVTARQCTIPCTESHRVYQGVMIEGVHVTEGLLLEHQPISSHQGILTTCSKITPVRIPVEFSRSPIHTVRYDVHVHCNTSSDTSGVRNYVWIHRLEGCDKTWFSVASTTLVCKSTFVWLLRQLT